MLRTARRAPPYGNDGCASPGARAATQTLLTEVMTSACGFALRRASPGGSVRRMSDGEERSEREVTEVDDRVLRDLESKYADVSCPVHGGPPRFEVDAKGGVVESFCCDALLQIFRELEAKEDMDGEEGEGAPR